IGHDVAFKPAGATEVKRAGLAFLLMKDRILKYLSERTTMLAGVSHDLRTPLTRMKLQLSMMPKDETTRDLTEDVDEMEKMLNGYLSFARGEGKETPELFRLD
ncbi:MAG: two-component sensor histidine kinase, partial [Alphaproteobacteria bacterium]|nr:two-component sensor histidine kinase [Alphaproteobacteria bacterium]